jgi:hypothetical protein
LHLSENSGLGAANALYAGFDGYAFTGHAHWGNASCAAFTALLFEQPQGSRKLGFGDSCLKIVLLMFVSP